VTDSLIDTLVVVAGL